jgi:hypothetical protein
MPKKLVSKPTRPQWCQVVLTVDPVLVGPLLIQFTDTPGVHRVETVVKEQVDQRAFGKGRPKKGQKKARQPKEGEEPKWPSPSRIKTMGFDALDEVAVRITARLDIAMPDVEEDDVKALRKWVLKHLSKAKKMS